MGLRVPFNQPSLCGQEIAYIKEAVQRKQLSGDGFYTKSCSSFLESHLSCPKVLLTHSCTAALEICALLLELNPGDEIIMPSYTFVSTANAFALNGATPVFVDIDPLTQNIDVSLIEAAINSNTKAIVAVHYAGISCDLVRLRSLADAHSLVLIEDAAQALFSKYRDKELGTYGHLATFSFHETKNISCGEGGALAINDVKYIDRSEIIREKGTDRSKFMRGQVDKYTWVDLGSSFLPGELSAAFLYAQLEHGRQFTNQRLNHWHKYHESLVEMASSKPLRPMYIPPEVTHNAHMYYLLLDNLESRDKFIAFMREQSIACLFHYVPLHSSVAGLRYTRCLEPMTNTNIAADCLVRLPLYPLVDTQFVLEAISRFSF